MAAMVLEARGRLPLLAVLYTAPVAAGGLLAGWALDRFDRRRLLAADAAVRGAVFAAIPVAALAGRVGAGQLYLTAACYGLLKMTSLARFPALIPELVGADSLPAANALEGAGFGVATVARPALAGLALGAGVSPALLVAADAVTYLVFAAAAASTPRADLAAPTAPGEGALIVVLAHQALRAGLGVGGYGRLIAAMAAGELAGALVLLRVRWRARLTLSILAVSSPPPPRPPACCRPARRGQWPAWSRSAAAPRR